MTLSRFWGIYCVADRHGEQLRKFSKARETYTVPSVTQDRLQMVDGLIALVYKQTRSIQPLAKQRSLSNTFLSQKWDEAVR